MNQARKCLDEIADLKQDLSSSRAADLLELVADLYFLTVDTQSAEDRDVFGDVMERMAYAADALVRARFAERVAKKDEIPTGLVRRLARDEICVARPILQYSSCLREGDLVSISTDMDQDHLMATAHRRDLTKPVTDVLIRRGEEPVLVAIARNVSAEISSESLSRLNQAASEAVELRRALSMRRDTSPGPIRRLKRLAATDFWQQVAETLLMSDEVIENVEAATGSSVEVQKPPEEDAEPPPKKKSKEPAFRPLSPLAEKHLTEAARAGKVEETIQCFSGIAKLEPPMIEHCLFHAHIPALLVLCKANKLSPSTFTALLQLRENCTDIPIEDTVGLLRRYEGMTPDTAQRIIRFADKNRGNNVKQADTGEKASEARG